MTEKMLNFLDLGIPIEILRKTRDLNRDLSSIGIDPFALKVVIRTTGAGRLLKTYNEVK